MTHNCPIMYHIPNDKRALLSAELTEKALYQLLDRFELNDISVSDICRKSGVSRATFYRLFDTPTDVLRRGVERVMKEMVRLQQERIVNGQKIALKENFHYMLQEERYRVVEAVVRSHRTDILYSAIQQHMTPLLQGQISQKGTNLSEEQMHYIVRMLIGILTSMLTAWVEGGCRETEEQLIGHLRLFSKVTSITLQ